MDFGRAARGAAPHRTAPQPSLPRKGAGLNDSQAPETRRPLRCLLSGGRAPKDGGEVVWRGSTGESADSTVTAAAAAAPLVPPSHRRPRWPACHQAALACRKPRPIRDVAVVRTPDGAAPRVPPRLAPPTTRRQLQPPSRLCGGLCRRHSFRLGVPW